MLPKAVFLPPFGRHCDNSALLESNIDKEAGAVSVHGNANCISKTLAAEYVIYVIFFSIKIYSILITSISERFVWMVVLGLAAL